MSGAGKDESRGLTPNRSSNGVVQWLNDSLYYMQALGPVQIHPS